ncbi:histidinol-phosphatase [bacterium]|nr:histidinol-phosphatase [bacterium]
MAKTRTPTTAEAVALLEEMGRLMSLNGENVFKVRAFEKAAGLLGGCEDLELRARAGTLTELEGVGKGIAEVLTEFLLTGESKAKKQLADSLPEGLLELTEIPGLGPKKALQLIEELEVRSVRELEYACRENRLLKLKGFGPKIQDKILDSIRFLQSTAGQVRLDQALAPGEQLAQSMSKLLRSRVELTGAIRRKREVLESIDLLIEAPKAEIQKDGKPSPELLKRASGALVKVKGSAKDLPSIPIHLHFSSPESWGSEWVRTTSTAEHWAALGGDQRTDAPDEEKFYSKRKLSFIEPVMRETGEEVALAKSGAIHQVLGSDQIQGVFHLHTTRSDGANSLEEMVLAARQRGYRYLGVSDHSQSAFYAQGLKEDALKDQEKEVRAVQEKFPEIRIFWGIESDILADGSLDYPASVLKRFDFVIASIHSRFQMDRETMTERVIQAIRNPYTRFLGHLTGRLLLGRKGYELDMERVIREAAKFDVAIEINAHPQRLDIDWRFGPALRAAGTKVSVNPDAHEVRGYEDTVYGVWMAQKALLPSALVLNSWDTAKVESWLKRK